MKDKLVCKKIKMFMTRLYGQSIENNTQKGTLCNKDRIMSDFSCIFQSTI